MHPNRCIKVRAARQSGTVFVPCGLYYLTRRFADRAARVATLIGIRLGVVCLMVGAGAVDLQAQSSASAHTNAVAIVWPAPQMSFREGSFIKIKAETPADGVTREVRFFAGTNLLGTVTQPPFNLVWIIDAHASYGSWELTATAIDQGGTTRTSSPVRIGWFSGLPTFPVVNLALPSEGEMFPSPARVEVRAELLCSLGEAGPVEFFLDGASLGVVDRSGWFTEASSYYSMSATNLAEGDHTLSVQYLGSNGNYCECTSVSVRVVKLGIDAPRIATGGTSPAGHVQFGVVTSFPGKPTIVQVSTNFVDWSPISTNVPSGNTFTFEETSPPSVAKRWYRAVVTP